jgi:hypothetical protein
LAAMAIGCAFGCARQALFWKALINIDISYYNGYLESDPGSDPVLAAVVYAEICKYWAPQQLLLSFEKLFNTYADFQVLCSRLIANYSLRTLTPASFCLATSLCLQILHYKVQLLLAAESVLAKRVQFTKILNMAQVALVLINIAHFGINVQSAALNVSAMNHFLKAADAFRSGQMEAGSRLYRESIIMYSDPADYYQGVS